MPGDPNYPASGKVSLTSRWLKAAATMRTRTSPEPNGGRSFSLIEVSLSLAAAAALDGSSSAPAEGIFVSTRHLVDVGKEDGEVDMI